MNYCCIFGNLGADPELRVSASGVAVLKLRIATNERVKKGEEWTDHTEWHSVTMFGKRAEALATLLSKGDKVLVTGKLRTTSYEKDGEKRYRTEIIGDDLELAGGKKNNNGSNEPPTENFVANQGTVSDDDIPF